VSAGEKLVERTRGDPRDWRIDDVISACRAAGITCAPPQKGSHYKLSHPDRPEILTVPAHRPIKPIYIRELVRFIDSVRGTAE
jgi:predicted RNA binding protein YcfA (HicA-like mRNA interferase family)